MDVIAIALADSLVNANLSGITNVTFDNTTREFVFTKSDGGKFRVTIPNQLTVDELAWVQSLQPHVEVNPITDDLEYKSQVLNNIVVKADKTDFGTGSDQKLYIETSTNKLYRWNSTTSKYKTFAIDLEDINSIKIVTTLPTATSDDEDKVVFNLDDNKLYRCIEDMVTPNTYIWEEVLKDKDVIEVIDDISTITPSADTVGKVYFDKKDNNLYKGVEDLTVPSNPVYDFENVSSKGIQIVEDYSLLPVVTEDTICYCKTDYTDTSVTPNVEYKSGFYLWDNTASGWTLISSETKERYPEFIPSHDYVIGDTFKDGDTKYEVIKDFTSGATVADNDDSVMEVVETYYYLTKEKKADLEARGLVKESNIYIISNADDVPTKYELDFTNETTINLQHNLHEKYPNILLLDQDENVLLCDIEYYSENLSIVHSEVAISGKAIVKK